MEKEEDFGSLPFQDRFKLLLNEEIMTDCCFVFPREEKIKQNAHKMILATASEVFDAMFFGDLANDRDIEIDDIQFVIFKLMLEFLYTDKCQLSDSDQLYDLYYAADKYMLPSLKKSCQNGLIVTPSNACKIYEFAQLYQIQELMKAAVEKIIRETSSVLKSDSFVDVQLNTLLMILDSKQLNIQSEGELFNALISWGHKLTALNAELKLIERIKNLLKNEKFIDCSIVIIGEAKKKFHVHKLILSMASPVFRKMLKGKIAEIEIDDIEPDCFQLLLDFMYMNQCDLTNFKQTWKLWLVAITYSLPSLVNSCVEGILKNLTTNNALANYETALSFDLPQDHRVIRSCMQIFARLNVFNYPAFENIKLKTLLMILSDGHTCSNIPETALFLVILRWGRKECERQNLPEDPTNLRTLLDPALKLINFLAFSPEEFSKGPAESKILSKDECFSIFMNITNSSTSIPMPEGFCTGDSD